MSHWVRMGFVAADVVACPPDGENTGRTLGKEMDLTRRCIACEEADDGKQAVVFGLCRAACVRMNALLVGVDTVLPDVKARMI